MFNTLGRTLSRRALNTLWGASFIRTHARTHVRTWLSQVRARARAHVCQLAALRINPSFRRQTGLDSSLLFRLLAAFPRDTRIITSGRGFTRLSLSIRFILCLQPILREISGRNYVRLLLKITILLPYISGLARDVRQCNSFFGRLRYFISISISIRNDIPVIAFKFALSS